MPPKADQPTGILPPSQKIKTPNSWFESDICISKFIYSGRNLVRAFI